MFCCLKTKICFCDPTGTEIIVNVPSPLLNCLVKSAAIGWCQSVVKNLRALAIKISVLCVSYNREAYTQARNGLCFACSTLGLWHFASFLSFTCWTNLGEMSYFLAGNVKLQLNSTTWVMVSRTPCHKISQISNLVQMTGLILETLIVRLYLLIFNACSLFTFHPSHIRTTLGSLQPLKNISILTDRCF